MSCLDEYRTLIDRRGLIVRRRRDARDRRIKSRLAQSFAREAFDDAAVAQDDDAIGDFRDGSTRAGKRLEPPWS